MLNPIRAFKNKLHATTLIPPKVHRDYWYIKGNWRYLRRAVRPRDGWKEILREPPTLVGFNITSSCDAKCCYCAYVLHKPEGVMDMAIFEKGVREFDAMGGGVVGLSPVTGEPLVDPHFAERIELASRFRNITAVMFDTNGILLKKKRIRETLFLLSSRIPIRMNISLPGFDKEMFERVYRVPWDDAILTGIHDLVKTNRECGKPLQISFVFQPDRLGVLQEPNFKKYIRPYIDNTDIVMVGLIRDNWGGQITQDDLTGDLLLMRQLPFRRLPCGILLDRHVDILVNGDVRMCGCTYSAAGQHDDLVIGNILESSLSDLWFGPGPKKLCERYLAGDTPNPCRQCAMYMPY